MGGRRELLQSKAAEIEARIERELSAWAVEILRLLPNERVAVRLVVRKSQRKLPPWPISDEMAEQDWARMLAAKLPKRLRAIVEEFKRRDNRAIPRDEYELAHDFRPRYKSNAYDEVSGLNFGFRAAGLPHRILIPEALELRRKHRTPARLRDSLFSIKIYKPNRKKGGKLPLAGWANK